MHDVSAEHSVCFCFHSPKDGFFFSSLEGLLCFMVSHT